MSYLHPMRVLCALLLLCPSALSQDNPPVSLPSMGPPPLMAADGKLAAPGRIPEGVSQEARARWAKLVQGSYVSGVQTQPIRSFSMGFDLRIRTVGVDNSPSKDVRATFDYLDEKSGYVRGTYHDSGRAMLRGPKGDWSEDKTGSLKIDGREDQASRDELDRLLAISRNFVSLARPEGVRLVDMRELNPKAIDASLRTPLDRRTLEFGGGRFLRLPENAMVQAALALTWIEVASPDFRLYVPPGELTAAGTEPVYRAILGLAADGHVQFAQFTRDDNGPSLASALFVHIKQLTEVGGYRFPRVIEVHSVVSDRLPWQFEENPSFELYGLESHTQLNPTLQAKDFLPN
ncbi:MAG: hypothetical protein ACI9HE_000476 [Planctomycetota bacterium]|jgi:hypothetical protein